MWWNFWNICEEAIVFNYFYTFLTRPDPPQQYIESVEGLAEGKTSVRYLWNCFRGRENEKEKNIMYFMAVESSWIINYRTFLIWNYTISPSSTIFLPFRNGVLIGLLKVKWWKINFSWKNTEIAGKWVFYFLWNESRRKGTEGFYSNWACDRFPLAHVTLSNYNIYMLRWCVFYHLLRSVCLRCIWVRE